MIRINEDELRRIMPLLPSGVLINDIYNQQWLINVGCEVMVLTSSQNDSIIITPIVIVEPEANKEVNNG